jgi:hypothetical protein
MLKIAIKLIIRRYCRIITIIIIIIIRKFGSEFMTKMQYLLFFYEF